MQIESFLEESALRFASKTALVCGNRRFTYAELDALANQLAGSMLEHGICRGSRVAVFMENTVEAVISIFAILKAGAVFTIINPAFPAAKVAYILNHSGAVAVVSNAACARVLLSAAQSLSSNFTIWMTSNTGFSDAAGQRIIDLDEVLFRGARTVSQLPKRCIDVDLAALIYTSGSTGRPKAVAMTHLNLVSAMSSIVEYLEITTADILLSVLPLSFSYGLGQVLSAFKAGATVILERSATYPHILLETIAREGVTGLPLVPTLATILLQLNLSKYDLSSLRYITSASAVFPSIHIAKFRRLLPGVRIYSMYGLTECCRVSFLPPDQIDIRPDSVGKGMPNQEAYIVGDDGARVRPGDIGELVVRGSSVMGGYWNDPQETEKRLKVGPNPWDRVLYTGDLFRADSEGFLYFVARKDDIIKTRGEKVSPREIEEVLYRLDDIAQAVIVGIPDPILGTAIKAVVTLRPGADLTKRQIKHHCAKHLDRCRIPSQIEIREELPKSENGKVNRKTLLFPCSA